MSGVYIAVAVTALTGFGTQKPGFLMSGTLSTSCAGVGNGSCENSAARRRARWEVQRLCVQANRVHIYLPCSGYPKRWLRREVTSLSLSELDPHSTVSDYAHPRAEQS